MKRRPSSKTLVSGFLRRAVSYRRILLVGALMLALLLTNCSPPTAKGTGFPSWSPDGTKIVFHSWSVKGLDAWVMNFGYPSWCLADSDVWVMDADGKNRRNLTNNSTVGNTHPTWSPDGSKIAFVSRRSGNPDIWVMNTDGTNEINLTYDFAEASGFFEASAPAWSPDGSKIAFMYNKNFVWDIWVMNVDGSNQKQLTFTK